MPIQTDDYEFTSDDCEQLTVDRSEDLLAAIEAYVAWTLDVTNAKGFMSRTDMMIEIDNIIESWKSGRLEQLKEPEDNHNAYREGA